MKHKTINGWTKELMKAQIRLNMWVKSIDNDACMYRSVLKKFPILKKKPPLDEYSLTKLQGQHDNFRGNPEDCAEYVCKWIDENVEDGE